MSKVHCAFCGLPFRSRNKNTDTEQFCCSGCALASRIPVGEEGMPVSRQLLSSLGLGFIYFNQFLFWLLSIGLYGEGRDSLAEVFEWVTLVLGMVVIIFVGWLLLIAKTRRFSDWGVVALTGAFLVYGCVKACGVGLGSLVLAMFCANSVMVVWFARGWLKRGLRGRLENRNI